MIDNFFATAIFILITGAFLYAIFDFFDLLRPLKKTNKKFVEPELIEPISPENISIRRSVEDLHRTDIGNHYANIEQTLQYQKVFNGQLRYWLVEVIKGNEDAWHDVARILDNVDTNHQYIDQQIDCITELKIKIEEEHNYPDVTKFLKEKNLIN